MSIVSYFYVMAEAIVGIAAIIFIVYVLMPGVKFIRTKKGFREESDRPYLDR